MGLVLEQRAVQGDEEGELLVKFDIYRPLEKDADANGMIQGKIHLTSVDDVHWKVVAGDPAGLSTFRVGKFVQIVPTTRNDQYTHMICG